MKELILFSIEVTHCVIVNSVDTGSVSLLAVTYFCLEAYHVFVFVVFKPDKHVIVSVLVKPSS